MFTHLHVHSHYSLLDGLGQIPELVSVARRRGFKALALTDVGSMYGAIKFYEECRAAGIKPIIGFEAFVAAGSRHEKLMNDNRVYHLVLLAANYDGYRNLMKLSSFGHLEGMHLGKPRIDKDLLRQHHHGIIGLSGCLEGEVATHLKNGDVAAARAAAEEYAKIFNEGYEDVLRAADGDQTTPHFFLELQDHPALEGQFSVNNALIDLGAELNLPLVVTRDVHYLDPEDADAADILTCIRDGHTVEDPRRVKLTHVDRSLNDAKDIESRFAHVPEAIQNTGKIAERCHLEIPLDQWHFPPIEIPFGKTADQELRDQAQSGLTELMPEVTTEMQTRLDYELDIISKKGYAPYFLAVADFVKWTRAQKIVATTRGSAAGSLVSYAIGITTVDPLYFKLPFERFLNPSRPTPPDIDSDFADNRRDEVIEYVTKKYGADKVAQIITFGTMAARASVRDVGRALGFSYGFCDQAAKLIPFGAQGFPMTIARALKEAPDLKKLYEENADVKKLIDLAQKIEGCARHTSIHAAGVVISPTPLTDFTPVQREVGGEKLTTQYEMHSVEKAGVLKMDFLGIRNLSILGLAVELVKKLYDVDVDLNKIPWNDRRTYEMLARGETMGVFQMGGGGMTRYLKELRPSSIFDIMAMVALYRPGPIDSIPEFIRRKHDPSSIQYLDDRLRDVLDQSYGVITYQDDVLLTAIRIAGYTWEEADKLRKAMGKKIPAEMAKQKEKFISGCVTNGLNELKAVRLWQLIEPFAAYGFNKAHAASYAVVAYQTAYLKANFPEAYMTAVLTAESDDNEKIAEIIHDCRRLGVHVLPPDINESQASFAVIAPSSNTLATPTAPPPSAAGEKSRIRFGLTAIKNLGAHIVGAIISERLANGAFISLENFLTRVQDKDLNKKSLESLIKCGAMDVWGDRGELLANAEMMLTFSRRVKEQATSNQASLFGAAGAAPVLNLAKGALATMRDKLAWEKELLGLYVSSHPFAELAAALEGAYTPAAHLESEPVGGWVTICGMLTAAKKHYTKKGQAMGMVTIEDTTGSAELLIFPKLYEQTGELWQVNAALCVIGKKSAEVGDKKIFAEKVQVITPENLNAIRAMSGASMSPLSSYVPETLLGPQITIALPAGLNAVAQISLKELLAAHPGEHRVYFEIEIGGGKRKIETGMKVSWEETLSGKVQKILNGQ
ncbi:MAG: polymerase III subunit alpha, DNA polymerase III subunit alpha protein [Candidatus Magasanikbacteria bacterium]|nr:polymerase III subunit alpha, DNA polymerase III subunit alpha protein [Candidatus Magasanikbacteria bacterium]